MTDVFLDSQAWYEVISSTPAGKTLVAEYGGRIHTSVLALAEIGSKVARVHGPEPAQEVLRGMEADSKAIHPVTLEDAKSAALLHPVLRARTKDVSLVDAVHLCTARRVGLTLISGDPAFKGEKDVRDR